MSKLLIPYDSEIYDAFIKDGVNKKTSMAFANMFGFIKGKNEMDKEVRSRMEEIGLLTPENTIIMEDIESSIEWLLMSQCYEGKMERFKDKDGIFKFKNTEKGNKEAIRVIRRLAKNV